MLEEEEEEEKEVDVVISREERDGRSNEFPVLKGQVVRKKQYRNFLLWPNENSR